MGQARNRGDFEQRRTAAQDRIEKAIDDLRVHNAKVDELDKLTEARMNTAAAQLITAHWRHSRIEQRMLQTAMPVVAPLPFEAYGKAD